MSWTNVYASADSGSAVAGSSSASSNFAFFSHASSASTTSSEALDFLLHPFWQLSTSSSKKIRMVRVKYNPLLDYE